MSPNTRAMFKGMIVPAVLFVGTGTAICIGLAFQKEDPILSLQCVDTASQETVFYQDYIKDASNDYDLWHLDLGQEKVRYVQPSGIVCTLRASIMAVENAIGKVD